MIRNYVRVAVRNLLKRKGYTFINIVGLATGIACCLLIATYILHEVSYDRFFDNSDRIYRISQTSTSPSKVEASATTPFKVGPSLELEHDRMIEAAVRFFNMQEDALTFLNKEADISFREKHFYFTEPSFFDVFGVELVRGNPEQALSQPLSIVLTEEAAKRYFGNEDPMGKTLGFKGIRKMTVTGIMEELPPNSHMQIDMLGSFSSLENIYRGQEYDKSWFWNPCWTYVLLREQAEEGELERQLPSFVDKYYKPHYPEGETVTLELQPVTDIHLYSNLDQEMKANNSIFYIYLFAGIAAFILIIACINFMNLATARSAERSREVGMRKVMGADRRQLFWQFMGESLLMSFLALVFAIGLVHLALPFFNDFLNQQLTLDLLSNQFLLVGLIVLFLLVGLVAGMYPALYLSSFEPTQVLKGEVTKGNRGGVFRKSLVTFQFAFSVALIIGTVIVFLQLQHMQNTRLGFDKEQVVVMPIKQNLIAWNFENFKEQALRNPNVLSVTGTSQILGSNQQKFYKYSPANATDGEESSSHTLYVTHDFINTYNIDVLAGRSFSEEYPSDSEQSILINKEMVAQLGVDTYEEAVGELFYFYPPDEEKVPFTVVGVVDNFNSSSIKKKIAPLVIRMVDEEIPIVRDIHYAAVKVAAGSVQEALQHLEETWYEINFVDPFEYSFQDQELNKVYASEAMMSKVSGVFAVLCILIACLGLFGLASYTSALKVREIGIRKTLGASVSGIVVLLSKEYIRLILLANVIAWPVTYYLVSRWLQNFPDRIALGWSLAGVFVFSAVLSIFICLCTVGFQSVRAALVNPVRSIRGE